jgi:ATP-dependent RNA helicase DDX55/SPB4
LFWVLTYRWKDLEIGKLAMGYGLLYLPSMSEVKQHRLSSEGFTPVEGVKFEEIKFKDKYREKQRQQNLQVRKEKRQEEKKEKGKRKRVDASASNDPKKASRKLTGKQRQTIQTAEDEEVMDRDYKLMIKVKKGLIKEDEYERLTGDDDLF